MIDMFHCAVQILHCMMCKQWPCSSRSDRMDRRLSISMSQYWHRRKQNIGMVLHIHPNYYWPGNQNCMIDSMIDLNNSDIDPYIQNILLYCKCPTTTHSTHRGILLYTYYHAVCSQPHITNIQQQMSSILCILHHTASTSTPHCPSSTAIHTMTHMCY